MPFSRWTAQMTRKTRTIRRQRPLYLERLEDRTLPSTVTWMIAGSGNWMRREPTLKKTDWNWPKVLSSKISAFRPSRAQTSGMVPSVNSWLP